MTPRSKQADQRCVTGMEGPRLETQHHSPHLSLCKERTVTSPESLCCSRYWITSWATESPCNMSPLLLCIRTKGKWLNFLCFRPEGSSHCFYKTSCRVVLLFSHLKGWGAFWCTTVTLKVTTTPSILAISWQLPLAQREVVHLIHPPDGRMLMKTSDNISAGKHRHPHALF